MPLVNFHNANPTQQIGTLAAAYSPGDPTITLALSLPTNIVGGGPPVEFKIGSQLFEGTAFSVGNTVIDVSVNPETADVPHAIDSPVLLEVTAQMMRRLRDRNIEDMPTAETDATLVFAPDGSNGVVARAETGGSDPTLTYVTVADESADLPNSDTLQAALGSRSLVDLGTRAYSALTGSPTIPANLDDLADVTAPTPAIGDVLTWNGSAWVNDVPTGGGSNGHWEVLMYGSAPPSPVTNQAEDDWLYIWIPD